MATRRQLKIKGIQVAQYELHIDVLFIKMIDEAFAQEEAVKLIAELENAKFKYVSHLNIEDNQ